MQLSYNGISTAGDIHAQGRCPVLRWQPCFWPAPGTSREMRSDDGCRLNLDGWSVCIRKGSPVQERLKEGKYSTLILEGSEAIYLLYRFGLRKSRQNYCKCWQPGGKSCSWLLPAYFSSSNSSLQPALYSKLLLYCRTLFPDFSLSRLIIRTLSWYQRLFF